MTAKEYAIIAYPRALGSQISLRAPPVFETGAEPKKPVKNLVIRIVWISFAAPVPNEKTAAAKHGPRTVHFRP